MLFFTLHNVFTHILAFRNAIQFFGRCIICIEPYRWFLIRVFLLHFWDYNSRRKRIWGIYLTSYLCCLVTKRTHPTSKYTNTSQYKWSITITYVRMLRLFLYCQILIWAHFYFITNVIYNQVVIMIVTVTFYIIK